MASDDITVTVDGIQLQADGMHFHPSYTLHEEVSLSKVELELDFCFRITWDSVIHGIPFCFYFLTGE